MNNFKTACDNIVCDETLPRYMRNVKEYSFTEFKDIVIENNEEKCKEIVESLYSGDIYILRNAYTEEFVEELKDKLFKWGNSTPSEFYKTKEGVPNFHRIVDESVNQNYAMKPLWHIYYLFPWNKDNLDGVYKEVTKRWGILKMLSGYDYDEFTNNTPKDGIIDRIHLYHYPSGGGYVETHSDPYKINRTIMTTKLSTRGVDYETGGIYFYKSDKEKVEIEDEINKGDIYFCFPTLIHGVSPVDEGKKVDWTSKKGRWLLGPWSIHSDEMKERHTCYGVDEEELNYEFEKLNEKV
jgi:hypothetical protein